MNGTAAAQPIWDDAWEAWLVQDAAQPSGWLIWNDAQSAWLPLPVQGAESVEAAPLASAPAQTAPVDDAPVERAPAAPSAQPFEPRVAIPSAPAQQLAPGPFEHPSAGHQLIAAPASRVPGGATAVLALGVAAVGVGALVTLIGLVSPVLFSIGVGEPRAVAAVVNVLAVLAFPVAAAGAVLGVLQLRGGAGPGRDRALIGLGVSGTVALLLLSRGLIAVTNSAMFGTPLI